jgi:iron complex outermembrane receptor protein
MASRYNFSVSPARKPIASAAWVALSAVSAVSGFGGLLSPAQAQSTPTEQTVTVTGAAPVERSTVGGFGDSPIARSPFSASTLTADELRDAGAIRLADLPRLNPALSDAYNAEGYWSLLAIRGYALDPRANFRRDGLPISGETVLALDNRQAVEILEGTSGIQAGTSSPGGLLNLVVKRPAGTIRRFGLNWQQSGSIGATADIGDSAGPFGWRVNLASESLRPQTRSADGSRRLAAAAVEWRLSPASLLEAEVEFSHQTQPSVPGFSLLGSVVPDARATDPRINLNNQPWSMPVVFDGTTASLRWQQRLSERWKVVAHGMVQRLRSDDRLAYPYGCSAEGNYDRYCSDGSFDFYDFRSDNERRHSEALNLSLQGRADFAGMAHQIESGILISRFQSRMQPQVDDVTIVGSGGVDGLAMIPTLPTLGSVANTNRYERSTELYLRDHVELGSDWGLWAGLRHSRLQRGSITTDGSEAVAYAQSFTTPWLALSRAVSKTTLTYASWGQGVESDVAPNKPSYSNAGQPLPALKSRQFEIGIKHDDVAIGWTIAAFDITRPRSSDLSDPASACADPAAGCLIHAVDGRAQHRGLEASARWHQGPWQLGASAMLLQARINGSSDPALNGKRPTNAPAQTVKAQAGYDIVALPGASLNAALTSDSNRMVLPDNSASVPSWTRIDLGLRYAQQAGGATLVWRVGVDNATDRRAWRESPYQFAHAYLFPLPPRTWRLAMQADL